MAPFVGCLSWACSPHCCSLSGNSPRTRWPPRPHHPEAVPLRRQLRRVPCPDVAPRPERRQSSYDVQLAASDPDFSTLLYSVSTTNSTARRRARRCPPRDALLAGPRAFLTPSGAGSWAQTSFSHATVGPRRGLAFSSRSATLAAPNHCSSPTSPPRP